MGNLHSTSIQLKEQNRMAENVGFDGSARLHGGKYYFRLDCNKATVKDRGITADSLHCLYVVSGLLKQLVTEVVFRWLRDDQAIVEIRNGSLLVKFQCLTDERFMQVWKDYKSGELEKCLQEEFSASEFEVEELKIDIENWEEVNEARKLIENRKKKIAETHAPELPRRMSPRIIVQGGAYNAIVCPYRVPFIEGIKRAAKGGYSVLNQEGKTAVDAVEEAVRIMENDGNFNAGCGSVLNARGDMERDAMIMDGHTMETGAVMAVDFANTVSLARKVMENTPHCALCAQGALNFAREMEFWSDPKDPIMMETTSLRRILGDENFGDVVKLHYQGLKSGGDTVTAIAMDANGHLACATSTGGIPGKRESRIGDAPLVGCGGYANEFGAATSTGHGEALMKMTLARDVVFNMENGLNAQDSAEKSVQRMQERVKGYGGMIAMDKDGNFGKAFNTEVMIWASVKDDELNYGMERGECQIERV